MASWLKASGLALGFVVAVLSGCKQGEGEICQISNDCEVGLTCNSTTGLCQDTTAPTADASVTVDASPVAVDAATPDAATPDAAPPDAATPDAAVPDAAP